MICGNCHNEVAPEEAAHYKMFDDHVTWFCRKSVFAEQTQQSCRQHTWCERFDGHDGRCMTEREINMRR